MKMLIGDESLVTTTDADYSIWRVNSNTTNTNITPAAIDYAHGVCFDGTKYAYVSTSLAVAGNSSKIATYNAYPVVGDPIDP